MFCTGSDQADGLKRLFRPLPQARVNVTGLAADSVTAMLAGGIGQTMAGLGLTVQWDDPAGLLCDVTRACIEPPGDHRAAFEPVRRLSSTGAVLVSARRHDAASVGQAARPDSMLRSDCAVVCAVFAAPPSASVLPALYGAIKAAHGVVSGDFPLAVVWTDDTHEYERDPGDDCHDMRRLCELNLARTVSRFLSRSLQFYRAPEPVMQAMSRPSATPSQRLASEHRVEAGALFFPDFTNTLLAHFGAASAHHSSHRN